MGRGWRPILVGAAIVAATFLLAQAEIFEPEAPSAVPLEGDASNGAVVFERECAACHGEEGVGGVGPRLLDTGLGAPEAAAVVEQGRGVMPAGIVSGQERADVAAYVASLASR